MTNAIGEVGVAVTGEAAVDDAGVGGCGTACSAAEACMQAAEKSAMDAIWNGRVKRRRMAGGISGLHGQEVADHLAAAFSEHAFGMKLDAFDGQRTMAQAHENGCAAGVGRVRGGQEFVRQRGFIDDERVVAGAGERGGQSGEDAMAVVGDRAGFAVHEFGCTDDLAAEGGSDGLMTEADAENGRFARHALDERHEDAGFLRRAGAGRKQDSFGMERLDLVDGKLVVAANDHLRAEFTEVLNEVVGEGIVVVENEDHAVLSVAQGMVAQC